MARTILLMSTGSNEPLRLRTRIVVWVLSSVWRAAVADVCMVKVSIYKFLVGLGQKNAANSHRPWRVLSTIETSSLDTCLPKTFLRSHPLIFMDDFRA